MRVVVHYINCMHFSQRQKTITEYFWREKYVTRYNKKISSENQYLALFVSGDTYLLTITRLCYEKTGGMLYCERSPRCISSVMRRLDNYFPLPDPFHGILSKTRASGREFARASRETHSNERSVRADARQTRRLRVALLSKLHLPRIHRALSYIGWAPRIRI